LKRALTISRQIDNLGAMPTVQAKPVKVSDKAKEILRFDLDNEADTFQTIASAFVSVKRWENFP